MSNPWESKYSIWKTKAAYFSWVRGILRHGWMHYPVKANWKKDQLRKVTPEERRIRAFHPSTKKVGQCMYCKQWFPGSKLQVDHIKEAGACSSYDTAEDFMWACLATPDTNMGLVCKGCHEIKTLADRKGIAFEEAKIEKQVIAKLKQSVKIQKEELREAGFTESDISNSDKRREAYRKYLSRSGK